MQFKELLLKLGLAIQVINKMVLGSRIEYVLEFYDEDDWQYELQKVDICNETGRIIFGLKLVGERKKK
jgi:hypothetical protein